MSSERHYERQLKKARYNVEKMGSEISKILSPVAEKDVDSVSADVDHSGGFFSKSLAFFRAKFRR